MDNIKVKRVEKSQHSGSRMDGVYKIPSGAVWTQWLSASVSQYKITAEDEMKEEKTEETEGKELLSSLCSVLRSDGVRRDEAGVNRERVTLKQTLHFHPSTFFCLNKPVIL